MIIFIRQRQCKASQAKVQSQASRRHRRRKAATSKKTRLTQSLSRVNWVHQQHIKLTALLTKSPRDCWISKISRTKITKNSVREYSKIWQKKSLLFQPVCKSSWRSAMLALKKTQPRIKWPPFSKVSCDIGYKMSHIERLQGRLCLSEADVRQYQRHLSSNLQKIHISMQSTRLHSPHSRRFRIFPRIGQQNGEQVLPRQQNRGR